MEHTTGEAALEILVVGRETGLLSRARSEEAASLVELISAGKLTGEDDPVAKADFPDLDLVCHSPTRERAKRTEPR